MARRRRPPPPAWAAFQALVFVLVAIGVTDHGGGRLATKTVKVLKNSAKIVVLKGKTAEKHTLFPPHARKTSNQNPRATNRRRRIFMTRTLTLTLTDFHDTDADADADAENW